MKDEPIQQGRQLTHFGTKSGMADLFSLGDHNRLVDACTSFLNLQIVEGDGFKFTATPNNSTITIPRISLQDISDALRRYLPWQIYRAPTSDPAVASDSRTVRVSGGSMCLIYDGEDFKVNYGDIGQGGGWHENNSRGHDANIVCADNALTYIYARFESEFGYGNVGKIYSAVEADIPAGWTKFPQRQQSREQAVESDGGAYAIIGTVSVASGVATIKQLVFDNIIIPAIDPAIARFDMLWTPAAFHGYRMIVLHNVTQLYLRIGTDYGPDGNEPGTSPSDWQYIGDFVP